MWSGDCTTTPDEMIAAVEASAIDVLCITDHNVIAGAVRLADDLPCRVVIGEELRVGSGEIIGLFLSERLPQGVGLVEAATRSEIKVGWSTFLTHSIRCAIVSALTTSTCWCPRDWSTGSKAGIRRPAWSR